MANDQPLLRNQTGTTRSRAATESAEELALEEAIARNARRLRQQLGRSVAEMADEIGISKGMLSKIENALTSCSLGTLARLAEAYDVPVTSLFTGADTERSSMYVRAG